MCFSATASFGSGTLLLAIGTVTLRMARRPAERPYAAIPLLFAVQQLVEGVVWLSFSGPAWLNFTATQAYSLFSHVLWPVYIPLAAWLLEPGGPRRRGLFSFLAVGLAVGAYLLYNLVVNPILARPVGGHVDYQSPHFYIAASMTLYLLATTVSLLVSSHVWVKVFGALALGASFLSYLFYARWFISVWCFFAALLSVAVALHFVAPRSILHQRIPS
ncbi:DUF6629 family protein [Cupriavidus pinatubonensis]|uniref:Uncharacterized protein n=1 Tax=Cupriavidus pinatubonensis TaxID=248026 RepID=A0ABM8XUD3_9BURK|nr:DUF6629 family protein [Cupriavidus pinatubonensis]CAG9183993.1 hypothetical protein LMG23994_05282 [Cupriavidus pinatubonensis]